MIKWTLLAAGSLAISQWASAKPYLVTFEKVEEKSSLASTNKILSFQNTNNEHIKRLYSVLPAAKSEMKILKNLWAAGSVLMDLSDEQAEILRRESFIINVAPDQKRKFLMEPVATQQLAAAPGPVWGLDYLGIGKLREKYPEIIGSDVRVGVLDTGIQSRHEEFSGISGEVVFKDFVNGLEHPYDDHGHGTHVAGTIAGASVGVAPGSQLTIGKILSASGSAFDSWILEGMQWMLDPDGDPQTNDYPKVINNSWGGNLEEGPADLASFAAFHQVIQNWVEVGIIPVFAAGNSGTAPNGFPAAFPEVLAIGAIDQNAELAEFSSRGPNLWAIDSMIFSVAKPDFSTPGVDVISAAPGNTYAVMSGTSMAAPHAVGILSLYLQLAPETDVKSAKTALLQFSERKNDLKFGLGIPNTVDLISSQLPPAQD